MTARRTRQTLYSVVLVYDVPADLPSHIALQLVDEDLGRLMEDPHGAMRLVEIACIELDTDTDEASAIAGDGPPMNGAG